MAKPKSTATSPVKAVEPVAYDGARYEPGEIIEMREEDKKPLVAAGVVEDLEAAK